MIPTTAAPPAQAEIIRPGAGARRRKARLHDLPKYVALYNVNIALLCCALLVTFTYVVFNLTVWAPKGHRGARDEPISHHRLAFALLGFFGGFIAASSTSIILCCGSSRGELADEGQLLGYVLLNVISICCFIAAIVKMFTSVGMPDAHMDEIGPLLGLLTAISLLTVLLQIITIALANEVRKMPIAKLTDSPVPTESEMF
jgi:hypothetical protein